MCQFRFLHVFQWITDFFRSRMAASAMPESQVLAKLASALTQLLLLPLVDLACYADAQLKKSGFQPELTSGKGAR